MKPPPCPPRSVFFFIDNRGWLALSSHCVALDGTRDVARLSSHGNWSISHARFLEVYISNTTAHLSGARLSCELLKNLNKSVKVIRHHDSNQAVCHICRWASADWEICRQVKKSSCGEKCSCLTSLSQGAGLFRKGFWSPKWLYRNRKWSTIHIQCFTKTLRRLCADRGLMPSSLELTLRILEMPHGP